MRLSMGILLLSAATLASAQTVPQLRAVTMPKVTATAVASDPNAGRFTGDPVQQLQKRVVLRGTKNRALEGRVATLEAALRDMRAATAFTCPTPTSSRNGSGATEDCTPYACNYLDGRCRTSAQSSSHCAPGFAMSGGACVSTAPTPDSCEGASMWDISCW